MHKVGNFVFGAKRGNMFENIALTLWSIFCVNECIYYNISMFVYLLKLLYVFIVPFKVGLLDLSRILMLF